MKAPRIGKFGYMNSPSFLTYMYAQDLSVIVGTFVLTAKARKSVLMNSQDMWRVRKWTEYFDLKTYLIINEFHVACCKVVFMGVARWCL